jgi:hypothetical protein
MSTQAPLALLPIAPPTFCEYAGGACDQSFDDLRVTDGFAVYASDPAFIADTIETAVRRVQQQQPSQRWLTWRDLNIPGQIIFCKICKALRSTRRVVADVTTLNANVLFEVGYAIGLGVGVQPIRDRNYVRDEKMFEELGMLDTFGYTTFENSEDLAAQIVSYNVQPLATQASTANREQPIYLVRSHIQNEGMVRLMSALKKSGLRFRAFDPKEMGRLSLHEAVKQVDASLGVIVHMVAPARSGGIVNNARCALVAGLAMAQGKRVLMLQEGEIKQPIDFRDVVKTYTTASQVNDHVIPLIRSVVEELQESQFVAVALPLNLLEKVDLGDLAAENEIKGLTSYFVPTGEYNEAKRGHARLVVGRKGAGKTAIFYGVRSTYKPSRAHLVLDLKPEGHQFTKLRESVLEQLPHGVQQHVLTAFWNYLLLMEIARKIVDDESNASYRTPDLRSAWVKVAEKFGHHPRSEQGDFSERLLTLVDDIIARRGTLTSVSSTAEVTQLVYGVDIRELSDAVSSYMTASRKEAIWLLIDNLDKGWPVQSARTEDILLIRSLLEASRKLQRQFENRGTECHAVVFIRNDIYEHLIRDTPDRGKDTAVILDWADPEVFKEIVRRRIIRSTGLDGDFHTLWRAIFDSHVKGEESFSYILNRTLMRPREVLRFCRTCLDVALSRGRDKVTESDIRQAERQCSEDSLVDLSFELKDVVESFKELPYAFHGATVPLTSVEVERKILDAGVPATEIDKARNLLIWFGFLGYWLPPDGERYSNQYQHDLRKMQSGLPESYGYAIHPAFRSALQTISRYD